MIMDWFNPDSLSAFDPIPIKAHEDNAVILDGHTRCAFTVMSDLYTISVDYEETLKLDMSIECVIECVIVNDKTYYHFDVIWRKISHVVCILVVLNCLGKYCPTQTNIA